ncbi:MAG: hypothetical protein HDR28_06030 [Lachnospiraceae bacterium]|nr:hypothetical protein [Lachnospiraceae bacterium]
MNELRKEKVRQAVKEMTEMFERLELSMAEIELVTRSGNVSARVQIAVSEMEVEAREYKEKPQKISKSRLFTTVCSALAIIISAIAVLLK